MRSKAAPLTGSFEGRIPYARFFWRDKKSAYKNQLLSLIPSQQPSRVLVLLRDTNKRYEKYSRVFLRVFFAAPLTGSFVF